jgi:hypothetical protein
MDDGLGAALTPLLRVDVEACATTAVSVFG